ncbi:MAG: type III polyketide synthase [Rhizobacter sp.]|nr:type III polyketide synthase [Bacteriovorax sp.]
MSYIYIAQTTFPKNSYDQNEIKKTVTFIWPEKADIISQFFDSTCVKNRNLALPLLQYQKLGNFGERNNHWKEIALSLQQKNIESILAQVKISPEDITLVASVNSTGLCVPSLEALLMNHTALGKNTKRLPLFGLGCLGGVAGINRVNDYLFGHPKEAALVLVTELCSLTFQFQDCSLANLVGTSLFGDGAGAVLLVGNEHPLAKSAFLEIIETKSYFYPNTEHYMGWEMVETGFQIKLSSDIPNLVRKQIGKDVEKFIYECGLEKNDVTFFIAHPGGPKVLDALVEAIEGKREDFDLSWESLADHGNVSSVSVINVLEKTMKRKNIKKNEKGIMLAMGPAFSLELSLVRKC